MNLREALERLYKGYLIVLASLIITLIPYPPIMLVALFLAGFATYFIYTGFALLSEVDKKYAPGKKGIVAIVVGFALAIAGVYVPALMLAALAILIYGVIEYLKGLWEVGSLKGAKLVRYGVILIAISFALSVLSAALVAEVAIKGHNVSPSAVYAYWSLVLLDEFLAGASVIFLLLGIKGALQNIKTSTGE